MNLVWLIHIAFLKYPPYVTPDGWNDSLSRTFSALSFVSKRLASLLSKMSDMGRPKCECLMVRFTSVIEIWYQSSDHSLHLMPLGDLSSEPPKIKNSPWEVNPPRR